MARRNQVLFKEVKLPKGFRIIDMTVYQNLGIIRFTKARRRRTK